MRTFNTKNVTDGTKALSAGDAAGAIEGKEPAFEGQDPARSESRRSRIQIAAYYRAQARGFTPGGAIEDWLEAEEEIDALARSENAEIEGVGGGKDAQPEQPVRAQRARA